MKISRSEGTLPVEFKHELFSVLAGEVKRQISKRGLTEKGILRDFESWRKNRRATRCRR